MQTTHIFFLLFLILKVGLDSNAKEREFKAPNSWDVGVIILQDGEQIQGRLLYNHHKQLVLFEDQGKIIPFSPEKIDGFSIFDKNLSVQRNFISISASNIKNKHKKNIFEVVLIGELSLLRQPKNKSKCNGYLDNKIKRFVGYSSDFYYFFLFDNHVYPLKNFKKQFFAIAGDLKDTIILYMKNNSLKFLNIDHQVRLIDYFNCL